MLKSFAKKIVKSTPVRSAVCWIVAQYIRVVWLTCKWQIIGKEHFQVLYDSNQPAILSFWHGRLLMAPFSWQQQRPFKMLISAHRDGELIANTVKHFGISWIKGSSSKGGAAALRALTKTLKNGEWVGITPDGPRGPRMRVSDGILNTAKLSGAPILPFSCGIRRARILNTWDRFLLPLPFSEGVLIWGEPIAVPGDTDRRAMEGIRERLEDRMNRLSYEVDNLTGREPIIPAPDKAEPAS